MIVCKTWNTAPLREPQCEEFTAPSPRERLLNHGLMRRLERAIRCSISPSPLDHLLADGTTNRPSRLDVAAEVDSGPQPRLPELLCPARAREPYRGSLHSTRRSGSSGSGPPW